MRFERPSRRIVVEVTQSTSSTGTGLLPAEPAAAEPVKAAVAVVPEGEPQALS